MPKTAQVIYLGDATSLKRADAEAANSQDALAKKMEAAHRKMEASAHAVTQKVAKVGRDVALGVAGAVTASVVLAEKMQKTTAAIASAGGTSEAAAKKIEKSFLDTAGKTEFSAAKIGAAYATIAGELKTVEGHALSSKQALEVMNASMALAEATGGDLAKTTEALGKVMFTYGLHSNEAAKASNILYNASKDTGTSIEQVTQTVDRIKGRLGVLAPSLGESAGLMEALAKHGVTGRLVMGALNGSFNTLLGGSKAVTSMAKQLGLEIYNSSGKFVGLTSVIKQLQPVLAGHTQQEQLAATKTLFGASANKQLLSIILQGPAAFQAATRAGEKYGAVQDASKRQAETFDGQVRRLRASAEDLGIKIGNKLIPFLTKLASVLSDGIKWLGQHKTAAIALAAVITTVLGAAVSVYVYTKAAAFVKATQDMIGGMKLLASKIVGESAKVDASFAGQAAASEAAATETAAAQSGLATDIAAKDAAIVTANEEAGASFTAMLGPIGAVVAALAAAQPFIQKLTGGDLGETAEQGKAAHNYRGPGAGGGLGLQSHGSQANKIARFLEERGGLSGAASAGITKILGAESGLSTTNEGSEGAYGVAQWLGSRLSGLRKFAGKHGTSGNSLETQLEYLLQELHGPEKGTLAKLKKVGSVHDAERVFLEDFERPNKDQYGKIYQRAAGYHVNPSGGRHIGYNKAGGAVEEGIVHANYHERKKHHTGTPSDHTGPAHIQTSEELATAESDAKKAAAKKQKAAAKKHREAQKRAEEYVNPFAQAHGLKRGREDEGIDFTARPGSKVGAIGAGEIDAILQGWTKYGRPGGQPLIEERLTSGPEKGKYVYYAEQLNAMVRKGQRVRAGQTIGTVAASGTGLELGFGAGGGRTLAQATTGYKEGQKTPAAEAFSKFLASIGHTKANGGTGSTIELATKSYEVAFKKELAKQTADKKQGESQLKTIQAAISSRNLEELTKVVGGKHDTWLARLEAKLHSDHTSALSSLATKLVTAHKAALAAVAIARQRTWNEGIATLRTQASEMVKQAGEAWKTITQGMIEAAHTAAIKAIEHGPESIALKKEQEEGEAETNAATERANAENLRKAKKNEKEVKATGDKEKLKEAQEQTRQAEEAITAFARQQDEKRKEKKIEEEKTGADVAEENELGSLTQRQANYETMLANQLYALTEQLNKAEIDYAQFAAKVNAMLASVGLSYNGDSGAQQRLEEISGGVVAKESQQGEGVWYRVGGRKASGGRVYPGQAYPVNEVGQEMFVPSMPGTIVPAGSSAGANDLGGIHFHGPVTMGSQRDAKRLAHTIGFRLRHG